MKQLKHFLQILGCILSSIYLTYILAQNALTTKLHIGFVFIYFLILSGIVLYCYNNFIKENINIKLNKRRIILYSFILTALILFCLGNELFPKPLDENKILITATGQKDELSKGKEVRITNICVDGKSIELNKLSLNENWTYLENENTIMCNPDIKEGKLELKLKPGKIIEITFVKHRWSGFVEIFDNNKIIKENLFDENGDAFLYTTNGKIKNISYLIQILIFISCIVMF